MISSVRLQNFRSYQDDSFEFDPAVNIIVGPNASGKTNLLEAVFALAVGGSYKAKDSELIKASTSWARAEGFFGKQKRILKLQKTTGTADKSFQIDGKSYKRLGLERTIPVVLFEPNHLQLVTRGPDQRREFIDDMLSRSQPGFKSLPAAYKRTLAQRNALLKKGRSSAAGQMFAWNVRLSELGGEIAQARQQLIDDINKEISANYSRIAAKKSKIKLEYERQFPAGSYASRMLSKLEATASQEFERGFTAYGPHREDVTVYVDNQPASQTASRGETRSLLLALKMFELMLVEKARNLPAILLLDDVFSELDGARRRALVDFLAGRQAIITTTDADAAMKHFATGPHLLALSN